jgi:sugar phosphate permease
MIVVGLLAGPFIYLLSQVPLNWSIWLVVLIMGTCQYVGMPISESYIISHSSERNRSTTLGIYYLASRGGPGLLMPALGFIIDRFSFDTAFTIMAVSVFAVAVICSVLLWGSRD